MVIPRIPVVEVPSLGIGRGRDGAREVYLEGGGYVVAVAEVEVARHVYLAECREHPGGKKGIGGLDRIGRGDGARKGKDLGNVLLFLGGAFDLLVVGNLEHLRLVAVIDVVASDESYCRPLDNSDEVPARGESYEAFDDPNHKYKLKFYEGM